METLSFDARTASVAPSETGFAEPRPNGHDLRMPSRSRTFIIAIGAVIAIPILFAALGASREAGLAFGILLVLLGLGWSVAESRGTRGGDGE